MPTRESNSAELAQKHRLVADYLQRRNLDAVFLTRRANFAWFTGGGRNYVNTAADVGVATLMISPDEVRCITSTIEGPRMEAEEVGRFGIEVLTFPWQNAEAARRTFEELTAHKTVVADVRLPAMPESVQPTEPDFDRLRWKRTAQEINRYRQLGRECTAALEQVAGTIEPGQSEAEIAGRIRQVMAERNARTPVCLIAADERIVRFRHPIPTEKRVERIVMLVAGVERDGLNCSLSRLVSFGPLSEDRERRHHAVCTVDARIIHATRPGKTLADIWQVLTEAYAEAGFPNEWCHHHQGGPCGYQGRDAKATPGSALPILEDQAFAWNPSIAGTKSEDTILTTSFAPEVLTLPTDWPMR